MKRSSTYQHELANALNHFYQNPVAKVSLELLLSIGLILLLAVFAVRPTLLTMSDLIKEIEDKEKLYEQLQKKASALATAQAEYARLEPRLSVLEEVIPSQPNIIPSLKILEKLATENQVILTAVTLQEIPPEVRVQSLNPERKSLPITIGIVGDYISIRNFANALLESRRSFIVDTISFSLEENRNDTNLRANITLNAAYYGTQ